MPVRAMPPRRYALALLAASGLCGAACAAEWSAQPGMQWRVDHDSNRRLDPHASESSQGVWLTLDAELKGATETSSMVLLPRLDLQRFSGDSDLDANNGSLQWTFDTQSEKSSLGLGASYERASTLVSELADTGIIDASTRRETTSFHATVGRDLTERQRLELQGIYEDTQYPDGVVHGLVGYRYPEVSVTHTLGVTTLTRLATTAFASKLTAPFTGYESRDVGVRLGFNYALSPRVTLAASAGVDESTVRDTRTQGYLLNLQVTGRSELSQLAFSFDRSAQPSGIGVLVRRDQLSLSAARNLAPRLAITLAAHGVRNEKLAGGPAFEERRYFSGDAGLDWRVTQYWILSFTTGAAHSASSSTDSASGWRSALSVRWSPRVWAVSR